MHRLCCHESFGSTHCERSHFVGDEQNNAASDTRRAHSPMGFKLYRRGKGRRVSSDEVSLLIRWPRVISGQSWLDPVASRMNQMSRSMLRSPRIDAIAKGAWLGHPVHPALTDLPIGFWTSAMMVDFVGGPSAATTARRLIGWGNLTALPTAVAGLADARDRSADDQRVAVTHAALNVAGLLTYVVSWLARRGPSRRVGVASSLVAAALLTASGHLGGYLAFGSPGEDSDTPRETQLLAG